MQDTEGDDLPEAFEQARDGDEAFWKRQESRIQGRAGQPCCTLSGLSTGLMHLRGRFAVIVHGEAECAACFFHTGPSAPQFYATRLTEKHFVLGETGGPLEECLRAVAGLGQHEVIFVLGTCPIEVIGDRFEVVVDKIQADFPAIPMVALHTHGLRLSSQAAMLDWLFATLAGLPGPDKPVVGGRRSRAEALMHAANWAITRDPWAWKRAEARWSGEALRDEGSLNLLGFGADADGGKSELVALLDRLGTLECRVFPEHATLEEWRAAKNARATFVFDKGLYPKLLEVLEAGDGEVIGVDLPVGIEATERCYLAIAGTFGKRAEMAAAIAEPKARAAALVEAFRSRHQGKRLAMGLRMNNNYEMAEIGRMGMGDYQLFVELGFDIQLFVQGPPERREKLAKLFVDSGMHQDFVVFPEPWTVGNHIGGGQFDLAYLTDHCRAEADRVGVPMLVCREFEAGFEGIEANLAYVRRVLEGSESR